MHASMYIKGIDGIPVVNSSNQDTAKELCARNDQINQLNQELNQLREENEALRNENDLLKSAVPVDIAPVDDNERLEYEEKIHDLEQQIITLTEENAQLKDNASNCGKSNVLSDAERAHYEAEIEALHHNIEGMEKLTESLKEQIANNEGKLNQVVQPHIDAYTKLTQRCNELENTINQNNVTYYKDKVEELNARIKDLSSELLVANTTVTELTSQITALKEDNNNLNATVGAKTFEIEELNKRIAEHETNNEEDDVKNSALYHMLQEIKNDVASSTAEVKTLLDEEEASEIMEFIMHLHDTYFTDIPFSSEQFRQFVWNVPRRYYAAMIDSLERYEPDILNPVTVLYLAFTDNPGFACAHFLFKLEEMIDHDRDAITEDDEDYMESITDDNNDNVSIDKVDTEMIEEDDYNE